MGISSSPVLVGISSPLHPCGTSTREPLAQAGQKQPHLEVLHEGLEPHLLGQMYISLAKEQSEA